MAFSDIFEQLLAEKGIKAAQVARDLEINPQTISQWKKQGSTPNAKTLDALADYFGVSVRYLLLNSEENQAARQLGSLGMKELEYIAQTLDHKMADLKQKMNIAQQELAALEKEMHALDEQRYQVETFIQMLYRATSGPEMDTVARLAETLLQQDGALFIGEGDDPLAD